MARLATMGTSSCATIAIGHFKNDFYGEENEKYKSDPPEIPLSQKDVEQFFGKVLYPTRQDLGRTDDYPFEDLMRSISTTRMKDKFTICTLNSTQYSDGNGYWAKELASHGFELLDSTINNIGGAINYIFVRNPTRPAKQQNVTKGFEQVT